MKRTNEEKGLLAKLASGVLDGMVGDEKVYHGHRNVYLLILHKSYTSTILGVIPRGKSLPRQGFYCFYDTPR